MSEMEGGGGGGAQIQRQKQHIRENEQICTTGYKVITPPTKVNRCNKDAYPIIA